jgi:hypothetical protein
VIISTEKKIGVFFVPKTGSVSLFSLFNHANAPFKKHSHENYTEIKNVGLDISSDFPNYKFFAFYRDPVDRCLSVIKYCKRVHYGFALNAFCDDASQIHNESTQYQDLSDELKNKIEGISNTQYISAFVNPIFGPMVFPQKYWFDHDIDITMLDYANYNIEVRRLMQLFDLNVSEIPKLNVSPSVPSQDILTQSEIDAIKLMYKKDYDLFASKGIYFSK